MKKEIELNEFMKKFNLEMDEIPQFAIENNYQILYTLDGIPYSVLNKNYKEKTK